ncbi:DUF732 domain-containing protein [Streptomyces diastaticus]|uniref:DUF732 domain-containing protein n=1 Tax=Streptomyces diastaticus TaxID=1956 RepID=UPI0036AB963D
MRRRAAILATATAVLLVSTACGSSDDDRPQNERDYLTSVYDAAQKQGSGIKGYGDEKVLGLGREVCTSLDEGAAPGDVVAAIKRGDEGDFNAVGDVASEIVGSAQLHLCTAE